jgi:hypothetical protein
MESDAALSDIKRIATIKPLADFQQEVSGQEVRNQQFSYGGRGERAEGPMDRSPVVGQFSMRVIASLEKSRNSLQTGSKLNPLFMLRCDRTPVMLTCSQQLTLTDRRGNGITLISRDYGACLAGEPSGNRFTTWA